MNKLVQYLFKKWFSGYVMPFETSDDKLFKMKEPERTEYYRQAKELLENRVFVAEMQEEVRKFMQKLAVSTTNDIERTAYRLTLKWINDFQIKVAQRAMLYKTPVITNYTKNL
jgi:cell fate (sporulation/competence/biofilm development) regulator YmcA (YheA/YmcA/DUF963 family)